MNYLLAAGSLVVSLCALVSCPSEGIESIAGDSGASGGRRIAQTTCRTGIRETVLLVLPALLLGSMLGSPF